MEVPNYWSNAYDIPLRINSQPAEVSTQWW